MMTGKKLRIDQGRPVIDCRCLRKNEESVAASILKFFDHLANFILCFAQLLLQPS
jgi:hypothetical protein